MVLPFARQVAVHIMKSCSMLVLILSVWMNFYKSSLNFVPCFQQADESLDFEEQILEAAKSIAAATSALVKSASAAQRELVAQGKVSTWRRIMMTSPGLYIALWSSSQCK